MEHGGDIRHQILNHQLFWKSDLTDFGNKKLTTSTLRLIKSPGSMVSSSALVSAGDVTRGITTIMESTSISISACSRVPRSAPDCGLRTVTSFTVAFPRTTGASSFTTWAVTSAPVCSCAVRSSAIDSCDTVFFTAMVLASNLVLARQSATHYESFLQAHGLTMFRQAVDTADDFNHIDQIDLRQHFAAQGQFKVADGGGYLGG